MLRINNKPVLQYALEQLPEEVDQVIFVVGWLGEQIKEYFSDNFLNKKIIYIEQKDRLGTGHALHMCKDILRDRFLVMMGDDVTEKSDLEKCLQHDLCLLAYEKLDPQSVSRTVDEVRVNPDDTLMAIAPKPEGAESYLMNVGMYVLDKRFFDYDLVKISSGEFGLPQTLAVMAKDHPVYVEKASFWLPLNTERDLERIRKHF
jgi:bifunctional UDP-N-acetylglucosamine pyrophosphorylase/glucosamine-1-phosphate N-acetyltransferase